MRESKEIKASCGFSVLIVAAGSGDRFGGDLPKQYQLLNGVSVLRRCIDTFLDIKGIGELKVVINPEHMALYEVAIKGLDLADPIHGGNERNMSIFNGLKSFSNLKDEEFVLLHDSARPLVSTGCITRVLDALKDHKAVSPAVLINDTLRRADDRLMAEEIVPRDNLYAQQTPQGFHYGAIMAAHAGAKGDHYTDDTTLVSESGVAVKIVAGDKSNFKITTADDLLMANALLLATGEIRTGIGFDVHAFDSEENSNEAVRLCGVDVPHSRSLTGHSDADVGLHAITDAILGAVAAGDIGRHFPPSNDDYKDMDSAIFLKRAIEILDEKNAQLTNIDITLICEGPKITPHAPAMITAISQITGLAQECISVKATTTEELGCTGDGSGIAAQAIATVCVEG